MIYTLTGPLGTGKTLMATQRAIDYASRGNRVVANYHIDFAPIATRPSSNLSKCQVTVLPSHPRSVDLFSLGKGGPTEDKADLLILDEAAMFLNSRTWSDKDREQMFAWFSMSRKLHWDVILLVLSINALDKQVRESVVEMTGRIRRLDRIKIPFTGIKLPKVHFCNLRYGTAANDVVTERWATRGGDAYKCYDTDTIFTQLPVPPSPRVPHVPVSEAYCVLPATLTKWRYKPSTRGPLVKLPEPVAIALTVAFWPFWAILGTLLSRWNLHELVGWHIVPPPVKRRDLSRVGRTEAEEVARHARLWWEVTRELHTGQARYRPR